MNNSIKKLTAALSAAILCALPMANALSANAYSTKFGDSNGDGVVNMPDAINISQWGTTYRNNIYRDNSDVNNDGVVNYFDAVLIQRALLQTMPAGQTIDQYLSENKDVYGDVNNDRRRNRRDLDEMQDILIAGEQNSADVQNNMIRYDLNGDGVFDWTDATVMFCYCYHRYFFDRNFTELYLAGDANNDGAVTNDDVETIKKWCSGTSVSINKENADISRDGNVTYKDADMIKAMIG